MMKWLAQLLLVLLIPFTVFAVDPLTITTTTLASGYVGIPYEVTMPVSGGIGSYSYSFIGIPAGLFQGNSGLISGTPSTAGVYNLDVSVTDSSTPPVTVSQAVSLRILSPVAITTTTIPDGTQKSAFSATLSGSGGAQPYTWSIPSGTLPQGVAIDGATGAIAGTPVNCGTFPFTARLADSAAKTNDKPLTINIACSNAYLLTGNAGVAGATVSYSGGAINGTVIADENGNYSIGPLPNGGYQVRPTKTLTTFTPSSRFVTVSDLDVSVAQFVPGADATKPVVTAFTAPATATTLTVPVSALTGTDNAAITGYLITETASIPSASAGNWSSTRPTSYTFAAGMADGVATVKTMYAWLKDATGNISESASATTTITLPDVTKPVVTAFTVAATASTLIVPLATLAATDNVAVTGYLVTESAIAPAPSASGWSATAPSSYTVTATIPAGVPTAKTIYAWSRDAAGNVSLSATAISTITITDVTKPQVSAFTMQSPAATLNVPVLSLSATDNDVVTGYLLTENPTTPSAAAVGWGATPPATHSFGIEGTYTLYAWVKDASGNVSESVTASVTITDVTKPQVTAFSLQSPASSLTVPVVSLSATDNEAVAGYLITETASAPLETAAGWSANSPASYTFSTPGSHTAYAWAKDAAGNVSQGRTATVSISLTGEAACGSSGGKNFAGAPGSGLCASGTATTVVGPGPWSWSCTGGDGGTTANCSAYKPGDCDTLGTVSIAEVQSAINMFLGLKSAELCVDIDGAPGVSISEVQKAINSFLGL